MKTWIGIMIDLSVISLGLIVVLGVIAYIGESTTNTISVGEKGRLLPTFDEEGNYRDYSLVCKTEEYLSELSNSIKINDDLNYFIMLGNKKCFITFIGEDSGDVLVIEKEDGMSKFRFIHPTNERYIQTGWTYSQFVGPINLK